MRCPTCDHKFKQLSSWPLAAGWPVACPDCGAKLRRVGKWKPAIIAIAMLILFQQLIGVYAFSAVGTVVLLAGLILLAMLIDERTIQLAPLPDGAPQKNDSR
ncbi:MAG: hypothetical protein VW268_10465 [Rhodospirillaceae bacterium]